LIRFDRADLEFQLFDVLRVDDARAERFAAYDRETIVGVLDVAEKIADQHFLPHAAKSDAEEPRFVDGRAITIPEIAAALDAYRDAGFFGAGFDHDLGGMQMPETVRSAIGFLMSMANIGTAGYPLLTVGAANVLAAFGTDEQKARFLRPMVEGRFFGTMCLSEPHAGSSLADITTTARPAEDGTYRLTGRKMWISGGEQEISENIIHLVLAKVPGGAPGVKGISLFIVPKFLVGDDGRPGARNGVTLAGLNHKMGYRGTVNTLLNFGESAPCVGYRVGEEGRGLQYMFHMMNEARIGVGLGAVALGAAGYQVALAYARERRQGRTPDAKDPTSPQVTLIEHADIRRLLLAQKAAVEGSLGLLLYAAQLVDGLRTETDPTRRHDLDSLLGLLTPIAKSWPSEFCLEANKHAIQVLGGAGYTRDYPVERLYRDNRLNPIHEGTHGIHGLDLLGRKVVLDGGKSLDVWARVVRADIGACDGLADLREFGAALEAHVSESIALTRQLTSELKVNPRRALANATLYLDMMGHVCIAWMLLRQAQAALRAGGAGPSSRLEGKLGTCRYFYRYVLPQAAGLRALLATLDETCLDMPADAF